MMGEVKVEVMPTQSTTIFNGSVTIHGFGRSTGNWRIGDFTNPDNFRRVVGLAKQYKVGRVWCPQAGNFNAHIAKAEEFKNSFVIDGITVVTGVKASGCPVGKGEAFFLASADCPIMVVKNAVSKIVCAHAGRDELIDRHWVTYDRGCPGRKFENVVDAIASYFGHSMRHAEVFSGFGIRHGFCHPNQHPKYGKFNQKLQKYIRDRFGTIIECFDFNYNLIIESLIRLQWSNRYCVHHNMITADKVCTHTDIGVENEYLWHSTARGDNNGERNGIFVVVNK